MKLLVLTPLLIGLLSFSTPAISCSQTATSITTEREREDAHLESATVLFRGVVEDVRKDDGTSLTIRRTEVLWGEGAPEQIRIVPDYFAVCPLGNLWAIDLDALQNGLSVTVIGEVSHANEDGIAAMFVLVDSDPDTRRILGRFETLR